jgi:ADP-heptose:LPS heptosyltransferase
MPNWKSGLVTALTRSALTLERLVSSKHRSDPALADRVLLLLYPPTLGCMILETPVFEALQRCRSGRRIAVATYGLGLQVLRHSPHVDELIATPHPARDLGGAVRTLRSELRKRDFHPGCVLTGPFDRQRAITRLALLAGSAWRGGYAEEPWIFNASIDFDEQRSVLDNNLRVSELLGCDGHGIEPRVFYTQQDLDGAQAIVAESQRRGRSVLTVVTLGETMALWPNERYAEVLRHAMEKLNCDVFLTGTAAEAPALEAIRRLAEDARIVGQQSVPEQTALFALSDLVLSMNTGPMHMARSVGVPMVVLGGSWDASYLWMPIHHSQVRIVQSPYSPQRFENYVMEDVSVAQVIAALDELAGSYPPDEKVRAARAAASLATINHLSS